MKMNWNRLLPDGRAGMYQKQNAGYPDLRSEFEKDYHRIIGSSSFRRLQDKTQVFALDKSDFIRTRLTHSLEVSSFAKSLGQNISRYILDNGLDPDFTARTQADICDILSCAGLIHDIGNPPFGHFGEEAIRDWFLRRMKRLVYKGRPIQEVLSPQMLNDFYHFEGNAQALRQVSKLHFIVNEHGMNLTFALLDTIIKYPVSSLEICPGSGDIKTEKMGFFKAEEDLYHRIAEAAGTEGVRHPLTFILEAADDIAYKTADIEDAYKKGFLSFRELREELLEAGKKQGGELPIDPVAMLDHQLDNARKRGIREDELYAVQNFLIRLQSRMIYCATYGFTSNYRKICEMIREKLPETIVYMMAYYPVNPHRNSPALRVRTNEAVARANEMVRALASEFGFQYIDVNDGLKDEQGNLQIEHTQDGIHFDAAAYRTVFERLKQYL